MALPRSAGMNFPGRSSSDILPRARAYVARVAVKVLLTEPISNSVSFVTGVFAFFEATP
jgi:hypothetical protein